MKGFVLILCGIAMLSVVVKAQIPKCEFADFTKADSIANLYPDHSLENIRMLSHKLTTSLSNEKEKFRAIYKWVCNNIANDYYLYSTNKSKREKLSEEELTAWNKTFAPRVIRTLVESRRTVCTGYAYLVKELALHAGISCEVVDGYGRNTQANIGGLGVANHSWNAVKLNGQWYLCDPTWSSGALDMQERVFVKKYNDAYFLLDPTLFVRNHYPLDPKWLLLDDKPTLQQFLTGPLVYASALEYKIKPVVPDTFEITTNKGSKVSFQFTSDRTAVIQKAELFIERLPAHDSVLTNLQPDGSTLYTVDHKFGTRGTHAVHVLVNGNYALTYKVSVR